MKKTILYDEHIKQKAKIVEYANFLMPVEYQGLIVEHLAVRQNCGLFDVSHMGEIMITGKDTVPFVNYLITNRLNETPNRMTYGLMLYPHGGVVDDLMCYYFNNQSLLVNMQKEMVKS